MSTTKISSLPGRVTKLKLNPQKLKQKNTWHSFAENVLCLSIYANGISVSSHKQEANKVELKPEQFGLRFRDTRDHNLPEGKYFIYKDKCLAAFEKHLVSLYKADKLSKTVVYFGLTSDPFLNLHKKFDLTIGCLQLLEQYRPGFLVVQTRSPMVIAGLPLIKAFEDNCVVVMPVETRLESAVRRYTPGLPSISERLIAADGLRKQGIAVALQVGPILPYGDIVRDAVVFAEILSEHADYINFGSLYQGYVKEERKLRDLPISQKLIADKQLRYLRPLCYRHLYAAVSNLCPEKLLLPVKCVAKPAQLDLFVAA